MGLWVKLKQRKIIEVHGRPTSYDAGDWVEVGKQTALRWCRDGHAEMADDWPHASWRAHDANAISKAQMRVLSEYTPRVPQTVTEDTFSIFAVPMGFSGDEALKQDNAIGSWTRLDPSPVIFLFGDEAGIVEACGRHGCIPMPRIERNQYGTPIVTDAFKQVNKVCAPGDVVMYINSDIIVMQDLADSLVKVAREFDEFLMVGRRWDANIAFPVFFDNPKWEYKLRNFLGSNGQLHGTGAIDYFAFRAGTLYEDAPPFAIGRSCWDNWLVLHALEVGVPVIDATEAATVSHQDKGSRVEILTVERTAEKDKNRLLYEPDRARTGIKGVIHEATHVVTASGEIVKRDH